MPSEKRNIIKGLVLDEVSHVDVPANNGSMVVLWKRATDMKGGDPMKPEDLVKRLEELESMVPKLETSLKAAEYKNKKMMDAMDEAGMDVEEDDDKKMKLKKRADPEYVDLDGEKILKSAIPVPLLVRLEKQAKELEDIKKAAEMVDLKKRAVENMPNMAGTDDEKAALMKSVESISDASLREGVLKSLKAADAAVAKSFKEIGSQAVDETSATSRLEKMAKDKAAADGTSYHRAYAEITKSGEGKKLAAEVQSKN
jgi:hypothetical protein